MIGNPFTDHPVGPKGDTGSSAMVVGDPVTGAGSIANAILFADGSGNLAQDAGFLFGNYNDGAQLAANGISVIKANAGLGVGVAAINTSAVAFSNANMGVGAEDGTFKTFAALYSETQGISALFMQTDNAESTENVSMGLEASTALQQARFLICHAASLDIGSAGFVLDANNVVTLPSLAGIGSRPVVVDANGKLSAP